MGQNQAAHHLVQSQAEDRSGKNRAVHHLGQNQVARLWARNRAAHPLEPSLEQRPLEQNQAARRQALILVDRHRQNQESHPELRSVDLA